MRRYTTMGLVCATVAAAQAVDVRQAREQFRLELPDVHFFEVGGRITTVYGAAFGAGNSPEEVAAAFLKGHAGIFGAEFADLEPVSPLFDGRHTKGLMYRQQSGDYKFTLVYFSQARDGIPVFRADVRLLVRNDPGYPLVLVRSGLRNLGEFQSGDELPTIRFDLIEENIQAEFPQLANLVKPERVIWAGVEDMQVEPRLAVTFEMDNGAANGTVTERLLFVADIRTGEILFSEDQIVREDVVGNTSGLATQGVGADICEPELLTGLAYAEVDISGGSSTNADENGDFVIPNAGVAQVSVRSFLRGLHFRIRNQNGSQPPALTQNVTPPGPADFVHNLANTSETVRSEVNAYVHANVIRDMFLRQDPQYSVGGRMDVYVNRTDGFCPGNAWYDPGAGTINFCRSGGGSPNTAWTSVIYHEYGHHLVNRGGSGQGQYGEGMGDVMSVVLLDSNLLGLGFFGNCNQALRDPVANHRNYPCNGAIHDCGQLISGCVWDTRNELVVTEPVEYLNILQDLSVNSIFLHNGSDITPQITIDWLTLDDDDANIGNGTPHYFEIAAGFGVHNMDAPPLELLEFRFPNGLPTMVNPAGGTTVRVEVLPNTMDPQPGSGRFFYNSGAGFVAGTMNEITANVYDAVFPAIACPSDVAYYFSAQTTTGEEMRSPANAPGVAYQALSATGITFAFADNFENDTGWTAENLGATSGFWQRGVPVNDPNWAYDPISDSDGSGKAYLTQNQLGNTDVDDGAVRLTSPDFDMSGGGFSISYDYYLYLTNTTGAVDRLLVEISDNGLAGPWVEVARHITNGALSWRNQVLSEADLLAAGVSPTATMRMRFTANDANNQSIVEAGLDAFEVFRIECAPAFNKGDMNCDGSINGGDIDPFFLALGDPIAYTAQFPNCEFLNGDMNGDGSVNGGDIDPFFVCLGGGFCP